MADFKTALKVTLGIEGGLSNNKLDRGGQTYQGISRKNWPAWPGWAIVDQWKYREITPEDIKILDSKVYAFYQTNFWDRISLNAICNQKIANELFDTGVITSTRRAVLFLQKALNLLNRNGELYHDIKEDGILGSDTLQLTNNHPYPDSLLKLINGLLLSYFIAICEKDPTQEEFLRGWLIKRVI
jgi:lysozyme family protein